MKFTPKISESGELIVHRTFREYQRDDLINADGIDEFDESGLDGQLVWDNLLTTPRVLLISAAGAGKTYECRETAARLFAGGKAAFFLTLEGIAATELELLLDRAQTVRFRQWLTDGQKKAFFFLDSADELLLSHGDFRLALRKFALKIDGHLHRAMIIVTSRPIALDVEAFASELPIALPLPPSDVTVANDDEFRDLFIGEFSEQHSRMKKPLTDDDLQNSVRIVGLTSLTREQIEQIALANKVRDPASLLAEIDRKRAWNFARRPQELIEICTYWNEHAQLGKRSELIAEDIRRKLRETGKRKQCVRLQDARALEGAERLALAQVLTRKRTIRFSDLSLDEYEAAIDPSIILSDWSENERAELLQRPLFGSASYGRVRFHHRSASEFLAARRLSRLSCSGRIPKAALFRLLFGECYNENYVYPSMRAVAAWLAIGDDAVREEMVRREPQALMDDGDPESFPISTRAHILEAYVERYGNDGWRGVRIPYPQVLRFASPDLSPTVRRLWEKQSSSPEVRELLIDLIQTARMEDCRDIANEVANYPAASPRDRITAITALAEMSATGTLSSLTDSLLGEPQWPSRVKEGVIDPLFPKHLEADELIELLSQIQVDKRIAGGIDWTLPRLIRTWKLPEDQIANLRVRLAELLNRNIVEVTYWPHYSCKYKHLTPALAALCLRHCDLTNPPPDGLVEAAVIAARLRINEYNGETPVGELVKRLEQASNSWRKAVYTAEGHFCVAHVPTRIDDQFGMNFLYGSILGSLRDNDFDWLIEIAADAALHKAIRATAFRDAMYLLRAEGKTIDERVDAMRNVAEDQPTWLEELEQRIIPAKPIESDDANEAKLNQETAARKAEETSAIASWVSWRNEILRNPESYFKQTKASQIVSDFGLILEKAQEQHAWQWNRTAFTPYFTEEIVERVRGAFCSYWRTIKVSLPSQRISDERNTIFVSWIHALIGVYAEAEQPNWARNLRREDAETAACLATVERQGIPPWVADLVTHHPEVVDTTLGDELSKQLADAASFKTPRLMSHLTRAEKSIVLFFESRVWAWLSATMIAIDNDQQQARIREQLELAIIFMMRSSVERSLLSALAKERLAGNLVGSFSLPWLVLFMNTAPQQATVHLEELLKLLDSSTRSRFCESFFCLFGDQDGNRLCPDLSSPQFTPTTLLAIVKIAYSEVRTSEDIDRTGSGVYSPTSRDKAQDGRDALLSALLRSTGPAAWEVKRRMHCDPFFGNIKHRIDQISREMAAREAEGPPLTDQEIVQVEASGEATPTDRNGMFQLMLNRLDELRHDIAAHEFSERPILVGIDKERDMQVWFAKRLQERENGAYRVDREALVLNNKETDIRLLSIRSGAQAVIELKLANNGYSIRELEVSLKEQLVGKYMLHENCRAGCLLVTMNKARHWACPDTGAKLSFGDTIMRLRTQARDLEILMNHSVRLAIVGIDLTA